MTRQLFCFLILTLLAACGGSRYERMRQQLDSLQVLNQSDSLLTDDSLALDLTQYFDSHGTPNDRMLAHYLLARTYADMGQAPQALDEFHTAAECADTTSEECDFLQLSKVYGQMGNLFYQHQLLENALHSYELARHFALLLDDTLLSIIASEQKAKCYYEAGQIDSAVIIIENAYQQYLKCGDTLAANTAIGPLAYIYIKKEEYDKAARCIDLYEHRSYVSSDTLRYINSWRLFQVQKSFYYLGVGKDAIALHSFRRELSLSDDIYHRLLVYKGLLATFEKMGVSDSVAKYAVMRTKVNDSTISIQLSEHLQKMESIYNYDRFKSISQKAVSEKERVKMQRTLFAFISLALFLLAVSSIGFAHYLYIRKTIMRKRMNTKYATDLMLYCKARAELEQTKVMNMSNKEELEKAKDTIAFLEKSIQVYNATGRMSYEESLMAGSLAECEISKLFKKKAENGIGLTNLQWKQYTEAVNVYFPFFIREIQRLLKDCEVIDIRICMLILLDISQKGKAVLLDISPNNYAIRRKRLYEKLFGRQGSAVEFDKKIRNIALNASNA